MQASISTRVQGASRYRFDVVIERQAARVVVVADGRVLLQQGADPGRPDRGSWWITPGGGLGDGESLEEAAVREVREETGFLLSREMLGPVIATRVASFEFEGRRYRQEESFFAVCVEPFTPEHDGWDELEQRVLLDHRWWTVDELLATDEAVYPRELAEVVQSLLAGTLREPIRLRADPDERPV
jgi:8-oxo-dGTP pyrophosphatase MutT (NUDIX family)